MKTKTRIGTKGKKQEEAQLQRYLNFLTEVKEKEGKKQDIAELTKKHSTAGYAASMAKKLGYITYYGNGTYVCAQKKFEPIHARKLMEALRKFNREYNERRMASSKPAAVKMANVKTQSKAVLSFVGNREEKCVHYLKKLGYKLMKPVSEYVEV